MRGRNLSTATTAAATAATDTIIVYHRDANHPNRDLECGRAIVDSLQAAKE